VIVFVPAASASEATALRRYTNQIIIIIIIISVHTCCAERCDLDPVNLVHFSGTVNTRAFTSAEQHSHYSTLNISETMQYGAILTEEFLLFFFFLCFLLFVSRFSLAMCNLVFL